MKLSFIVFCYLPWGLRVRDFNEFWVEWEYHSYLRKSLKKYSINATVCHVDRKIINFFILLIIIYYFLMKLVLLVKNKWLGIFIFREHKTNDMVYLYLEDIKQMTWYFVFRAHKTNDIVYLYLEDIKQMTWYICI